MPDNPDRKSSGQPCDCLGCQIRELIENASPGDCITPDEAIAALKALAGNAVTLIIGSSSNPLEAGKVFISLFGKQMVNAISDGAGKTHQ